MSQDNGKICANCQFWGGDRTVDQFCKYKAAVNTMFEQGVCQNKDARNYYGRKLRADSVCGYFTKWDQLKK